MASAAEWLLGEEVTQSGDWSVARPGLAPGGWAFEFANVNYPDVDDTAEVVLALERLTSEASRARIDADLRRRIDGAIGRALVWAEGCRAPTAAGAPSTPTTHARWCASCPFWISAR